MPSKSKAATAARPDDEAVRHRAYMLWEADGRPAGKSDHYWHLAMSEMTEKMAAAKPARAAKDAAPKADSKPARKAEVPVKKAEAPVKKAEAPAKKAAPKPRAAVGVKKTGKSASAPA